MKRKMQLTILFLILVTALAGCGKKSSETDGTQAASSKNYVYKCEEIEIGKENARLNKIINAGDELYIYFYEYNEEDNTQVLTVMSMDLNGTIKEEHEILIGENTGLSIQPDGNGNLYGIKNIYKENEENPEEYTDNYYFTKMSMSGEEIFSIDFQSIPEIAKLTEENGYFYTGQITWSENTAYIGMINKVAKFDFDGNFLGFLGGSDSVEFENVNLIPLADQRIAALSYEETGAMVSILDIQKETLGEKYKLPGVSYEYSLYPGIGYDLYLSNTYGVYGYNIGDEDKTQIMNFIDSDLGVFNIYNIAPVSETEFFATYEDTELWETRVAKFTKVAPGDVIDKTVLTLACAGLDWDLRGQIVRFNKENEKYRIKIQDYSSLYGSETDYTAGMTRLNNDIIAGKIPDIIVINSSMPVESYIGKGLLEDIKPFIEKDEELDMSNYMPNIVEAFSADGKLYQLTPTYIISTVVGKTSDVGEERGWNVKEIKELLAAKPEGTKLLDYVTRDSMLTNCITIAGGQFIDWENGVCDFNTQSFIELLEFIKEFPEEVDEAEYTESYWDNYDSMWREGRVLCQSTTIYDFRGYNTLAKGTFGEPITMIGYPSANNDGSAIIANLQLAMSAKSNNKEGIWEFMRYFITDEFQDNITYGFPLSIKRMDAMIEEAMKVATYTDEEGKVIEQPETYYLDGIEIPIDPISREEAEKLKTELYSFTQTYNYDENLLNIIKEEAAPFFEGQKSANEVADIIQNRVQIYVQENR